MIPFVKRKGLNSKVLLLDDVKYDTWISKVAEEWDGAIPITLIISKPKNIRKVMIGEITYKELEQTLTDLTGILVDRS